MAEEDKSGIADYVAGKAMTTKSPWYTGATQGSYGAFGEFPGATPKYAKGREESYDFRETMARMYLQVKDFSALMNEYANEPRTQKLISLIAGETNAKGVTTKGGNGYVDFILQSVNVSFVEKYQLTEMLADDHVLQVFGSGATMYTFSGTLLNTKQDDQAVSMFYLYRDLIRGSQLAKRATLLSIRYDSWIVSGAVLGLTTSLSAEMEMAIPFNFQMLSKKVLPLPSVSAGFVTLDTGFAAGVEGYSTFIGGLSQEALETRNVPPVAVPANAVVPAASQATAPVTTTVEPSQNAPVLANMQASVNAASSVETSAFASALRNVYPGANKL